MTTELKELVEKLTTGDSPHLALKASFEDGTLARLIPELAILYGVPQVAEWHPEVDTGLHIELVLQVAAGLSRNPRVRFAALVHDFGKGVTPKNEWPKHFAHEEKGVPIVEQFCQRAGVPEDWCFLGVAISRWHLFAHRALESRPRTIVKLFIDSGFIDKPELFEDFLLACEADKRGRGGLMDSVYPQRPLLQAAMRAVKEATPHTVNLPYEEALHEARCNAVSDVFKQFGY
jgi:tRNA nucleotidyltransferase (CCA-adding enzyme)